MKKPYEKFMAQVLTDSWRDVQLTLKEIIISFVYLFVEPRMTDNPAEPDLVCGSRKHAQTYPH